MLNGEWLMKFWPMIKSCIRRESGITFMETAIALAILGVISVAFLNGLTTTSKSVFMTLPHPSPTARTTRITQR